MNFTEIIDNIKKVRIIPKPVAEKPWISLGAVKEQENLLVSIQYQEPCIIMKIDNDENLTTTYYELRWENA